MIYDCLRCGMEFNQKNHLIGHLNRKNICKPILEQMSIEEVKKYYGFTILEKKQNSEQVKPGYEQVKPGYEQVKPGFEQVMSESFEQAKPGYEQAKPGYEQAKPGKMSSNAIKCDFCGKHFTRTYGLTCHLKVCKKKKDNELLEENKLLKDKLNKLEGLCNNINNNTTNNNTNNMNNMNSHNDNSTHNTININNYGCENKDYITKGYLIKLLKEPFQAIPRLIEYTHFNNDHPENQNIKLPNKKQPYVKVLKDDKWVYADRKSTILDLIDEKHCELNDSPLVKYVENKFSEHLQDRFERFNERYLNEEKEFTKQLYNETELVMINNS